MPDVIATTLYQQALSLWDEADLAHQRSEACQGVLAACKSDVAWASPSTKPLKQAAMANAIRELRDAESDAEASRRAALRCSSDAAKHFWGVELGVRYSFFRDSEEQSRFIVDFLRPTGTLAGKDGFICSGPAASGRPLILLGSDDVTPIKQLATVLVLPTRPVRPAVANTPA